MKMTQLWEMWFNGLMIVVVLGFVGMLLFSAGVFFYKAWEHFNEKPKTVYAVRIGEQEFSSMDTPLTIRFQNGSTWVFNPAKNQSNSEAGEKK
jgi:cytoskeletal protein RodZ